MKIKQITAVIMAALVVASFSGCGKSSKNNANIASPVALLDTSDMFSGKDLEVGYDESEVTRITLIGSSAKVEGSGASVSGSTVTVSEEGTYLLSGTLNNGRALRVKTGNPKTWYKEYQGCIYDYTGGGGR